jgi:hypothetical protein
MDCPDCKAAEGRWHKQGCKWEQCPYCGNFLTDCGPCQGWPPLDDRIVWQGCCPWLLACADLGLFERQVDGQWEPCRAEDPGSQPDVLRFLHHYRWNREAKQFEPRRQRQPAAE